MSPIGVTGSTGRVGSRVARQLAAAGVAQRLLVRDPSQAPDLPGATVAVAEYGDTAAASAALRGIEVLFMVSGAEAPDRLGQHRAFVAAAAAAGVRHVVYLSFYGASPDATFTLARDHFHTEEALAGSGMATTLLRDNLYADFVPFFVSGDTLRCPAGEGRAAFVAIADVADCAAAVLRDPPAHLGATYTLTGPQSLSMPDVVRIVSEVTGRTTRYVPETLAEAYRSRAHYGAPQWQLDAWVSTYTAIAAGELDGVSGDVERLSDHPATPLTQVLRDPATAGS